MSSEGKRWSMVFEGGGAQVVAKDEADAYADEVERLREAIRVIEIESCCFDSTWRKRPMLRSLEKVNRQARAALADEEPS